MSNDLITQENIESRIFIIRDQKVMIDRDLAKLYGVSTKSLNQQVKRNKERFPENFMFTLSEQEKIDVVTICDHLSDLRFSHQLPYVFTEHGIAMLSSVLNSDRAVKMSIFIINTFVKLRKALSFNKEIADKIALLEKRVLKHDSDIRELVKDICKLTIKKTGNRSGIGFLK